MSESTNKPTRLQDRYRARKRLRGYDGPWKYLNNGDYRPSCTEAFDDIEDAAATDGGRRFEFSVEKVYVLPDERQDPDPAMKPGGTD